MDIRRLVVAAALLTYPAGAGAQSMDAVAGETVIVRVYKQSVRPAEFSAARSYAAGLLRSAGIGVSWLQCWSDPHAVIPMPPDCQRPLNPTDVILRIVTASDDNAATHGGSLGFSLIDPHAATAHVATVYADRVAALARDAHVDGDNLLGRAIAHEIGHLLMRTGDHARHGLMRALWTATELRLNRPGDWSFSKKEADIMRTALAGTE